MLLCLNNNDLLIAGAHLFVSVPKYRLSRVAEASFSPDSQFVISGSTDGRIHIWNAENGQKVNKF